MAPKKKNVQQIRQHNISKNGALLKKYTDMTDKL